MHEWISDKDETPLVVIDTTVAEVDVPNEYIKDDTIVLNVAYSATRNLTMNNECVSFEARFGGVARTVYFPVDALVGVYSRESGQGMQFRNETVAPVQAGDLAADDGSFGDDPDPSPTRPSGPNLRIVK